MLNNWSIGRKKSKRVLSNLCKVNKNEFNFKIRIINESTNTISQIRMIARNNDDLLNSHLKNRKPTDLEKTYIEMLEAAVKVFLK